MSQRQGLQPEFDWARETDKAMAEVAIRRALDRVPELDDWACRQIVGAISALDFGLYGVAAASAADALLTPERRSTDGSPIAELAGVSLEALEDAFIAVARKPAVPFPIARQ